jgi:hypothetical protein
LVGRVRRRVRRLLSRNDCRTSQQQVSRKNQTRSKTRQIHRAHAIEDQGHALFLD